MNYYLKRGLQALFTLWAVLTITFVLTRWMPGGPVDFLRAQMIAGNVGPASGEVTVQDPAGSEQFDDLGELDGRFYAEVAAAVANGATGPERIAYEVDAAPEAVEDALALLADHGVVRATDDGWRVTGD
jgi:ABC-type dipeptide/oligopeptide/nickel transport system permease component